MEAKPNEYENRYMTEHDVSEELDAEKIKEKIEKWRTYMSMQTEVDKLKQELFI